MSSYQVESEVNCVIAKFAQTLSRLVNTCSWKKQTNVVFSCVQVSSDLLDIDGSEEEESVYIYVRTLSQLTTHHPSRLVMVSSLTLPCTPTQPDVAVTVTTNGEDVTDKFQYDPTIGFWPAAITSLASTSFTCYFTLDDQTESLSVKVLSRAGEKVGAEELEVTVTSQTKQTDRLQLVCKVFRHQQRQVEIVDIYWQLPALDGQQLHKDDIVMMMRDRFTLEEVELDSVIVSTLVIEEVDEDDQGVYSCRVETIDGKIFEAETFVNVDSIPSELITILPTETGQSNMIPNNSDNAAQVGSLLSVFVYICGLLHIFYR